MPEADVAALCDAAAERWREHMLLGNFEAAWRESDSIAATGREDPHRFWNGEPWEGKRVMLRCLHGLGDTIQFIRYAPLLKRTCRSLVVQSHPRLVRLLATVPGVDRAVAWEQGEADWDVQLEVNELPRIFRTQANTIPAQVPYVSVSSASAAWARSLVDTGSTKRKVGVIWKSGEWNEKRSLPACALAPLLEIAGCEYYILQKNPVERVAALDVECHANDVADSAALLSQMDLVISVDTMTAHLAGALAKPVWVLLPAQADWRWMRDRQDSPWYPTMRLFRQQTQGDWSAPVAAIASQLQRMSPWRHPYYYHWVFTVEPCSVGLQTDLSLAFSESPLAADAGGFADD